MYESIDSLRSSIANQQRTAVEAVGESLSAIADDTANAFTAVQADTALDTAATIDDTSHRGPLAGIPIALKDLIHHAGQVTTAGSSFYRHEASASATVVDRLEAAGAVIVGRTGLHEFAYGFSSENVWFGPVRNPWDLGLSPGGSSGGSAAAVAAGLVPGALGTDTGGSVRVPAALCGIPGLKVTHGRVPISGVVPLAESLDTVGPLARSTHDLASLYGIIRGYDNTDPWSVDVRDHPSAFTSLSGLKVGIPHTWIEAVPTSASTRTEFATFTDALADAGAECFIIDHPHLEPSPHLATLSAAEAAGVHRSWFTDLDKDYGPDVEQRLADAMEVTVDQVVDAKRWQARLVQVVRAVFATCDVMMTPTVGHGRKIIGEDAIDLDGSLEFYRPVLAGFTALVNQFQCPAIALPLNRPGVPPPSVQFIAPWWDEELLLDLGQALEARELVGAQMPGAQSLAGETLTSDKLRADTYGK